MTDQLEGSYFLHLPGRDEPLHIGKSSAGWYFKLHVEPPRVKDLADWETLWSRKGAEIRHASGAVVSPEDMRKIIAERHRGGGTDWTPEKLEMHHGELGLNGLARHKLRPPFCGRGEGTYDLVEGYFR